MNKTNTKTNTKTTKTERAVFKTVNDVKKVEVVDSKVSEKYVPIKTSEIVELLSPEFEFLGGQRFSKGSSMHYVDLKTKDGDTVRIYNSFDRRLAFSLRLESDGFHVELGTDRIIHMGHRAQDLTEALKDAKKDILNNIEITKRALRALDREVCTPEVSKEITEIIFEKKLNQLKKKDPKAKVTTHLELLVDKGISVKAFVKASFASLEKGTYSYTVNGKKKQGRPQTHYFTKVTQENQILKFLSNKYPELFL